MHGVSALVCCAVVATSAAAAPPDFSRLTVTGGEMRDARGRVVMLRGVNLQ